MKRAQLTLGIFEIYFSTQLIRPRTRILTSLFAISTSTEILNKSSKPAFTTFSILSSSHAPSLVLLVVALPLSTSSLYSRNSCTTSCTILPQIKLGVVPSPPALVDLSMEERSGLRTHDVALERAVAVMRRSG